MALPLLEIFSALADHQAAAREAQEAERERAQIQAQIAQVTKDAEETVRKGMDQAQDYARQIVEGRELEAHGREGLAHRDLRKCKERVQSLMREISGLRRSQRAPLRVAPRGLPYSIQVGRNE